MNIVSWLLLLMLLGCADKLAKEGYTRIFFVSHNDQKSGATSLMELVGGLNVYGINLSSPGDGGSIHYKPGDLSLDGVWVKNGNYKLTLPPGTYSVYVDDNGKETCNGGDGYANMCSITLYESGEERNVVIDHAVY